MKERLLRKMYAKTSVLFFLFGLLLLIAGCSEDRNITEAIAEKQYISFHITKSPDTRAAIAENGRL